MILTEIAEQVMAPTRYDFPVPEWCRTIWASPDLREMWEPRIRAINLAWAIVERESVGANRSAALLVIEPQQLVAMSAKAAERGLSLIVLSQEGAGGSYANAREFAPGQPWNYRVVLCEPRVAVPFLSAWRESDNVGIGLMLGFPLCCAQFFHRVWIEEKWVDTTWPMVQTGTGVVATVEQSGGWTVDVSGPPECNILWRWLGPRLVPHLPCSFACEQTRKRGHEFHELMRFHGFEQQLAWLDELLSWQVEWSAWHGIAEIKTPILKVSAKTDATKERLAVRRVGVYPSAGPTGVSFPHPLRIVRKGEWVDNGFSSLEAQEKGHQMVLDALRANPPRGTVLDLGCGNGELLRKVRDLFGMEIVGVESDQQKIHEPWIRAGNLKQVHEVLSTPDVEFWCDTVLVSVRRFEEMPPLRAWTFAHARQVIEYSYDPPMFAARGVE